ncbi:MAG: PH domain-containing protein [Schumannella sp.]
MTDDASAPASARLDPVPGEWRRVSPKYVVVDLVGNLIGGVVATVALGLPWFFSQVPFLLILPVVVAVVALVTLVLTPRRVRAIGYRLRDDDLLFRRGIMFQRCVAVPYGRMQLVDITRGPLARAVGLAELKLVTAAAASNVTIPGLPIADAEALRDHLVELAESRRAGL